MIIGMGLIGQPAYKLVESAGAFPIGVDISKGQVNFVKQNGIKDVFHRKSKN